MKTKTNRQILMLIICAVVCATCFAAWADISACYHLTAAGLCGTPYSSGAPDCINVTCDSSSTCNLLSLEQSGNTACGNQACYCSASQGTPGWGYDPGNGQYDLPICTAPWTQTVAPPGTGGSSTTDYYSGDPCSS